MFTLFVCINIYNFQKYIQLDSRFLSKTYMHTSMWISTAKLLTWSGRLVTVNDLTADGIYPRQYNIQYPISHPPSRLYYLHGSDLNTIFSAIVSYLVHAMWDSDPTSTNPSRLNDTISECNTFRNKGMYTTSWSCTAGYQRTAWHHHVRPQSHSLIHSLTHTLTASIRHAVTASLSISCSIYFISRGF